MLAALVALVSHAKELDPAGALQATVDKAIADGVPELVIPPGNYDFGNRTFLIRGAKDMVLTTTGATAWFWGANGGIVLKECSNVVFKGFSLDRNPAPFFQAKVEEVDGKSCRFGVEAGYDIDVLHGWFTTGGGGMEYPMSRHYSGSHLSATDGLPLLAATQGTLDMDPKDLSASLKWLSENQFEVGCQDYNVGDYMLWYMWQGYNYVVANSSNVTSDSITVHASSYIALSELDGAGGHSYRNCSARPAPGRIIASSADGFHSTDVDRGPTVKGLYLNRLLDDYFNMQNSMLFVKGQPMGPTKTSLTVVHPHTNDQLVDGFTDLFYGTTEPLQRMKPGDMLRFFDPVTYDYLGQVPLVKSPTQLDAAANTTLGQAADSLWNNVTSPPYNFVPFQPEGYRVQHFRSSVYSVELAHAPPVRPSLDLDLAVPYIVESGRSRCNGAEVRDSIFVHSTGLFGRWKSSNSRIVNNSFSSTSQLHLELQMIPSFYEGPVFVDNVTVSENIFYVPEGTKTTDAKDFIWHANGTGLVVNDNKVVPSKSYL